MILEFVVFVTISSLLWLKWHLLEHFGQFKRLRIKGPEPSIFSGNLIELRKKGQFQAMQDWTAKYGRVFGFFEGYTPVLVVSEPAILKEVLLRDAANFMRRKPFPLAPRKSLGLFLEEGEQWKRSRTFLTPAFSTGKLKKMMPIMSEAADILVENLFDRSKTGQEVDIYKAFQSLSLDVVGRCAFGMQTNAQVNENDQFLVTIRQLFYTMTTTFIQPLVMLLPFVSHFVFAVKNLVFIFGMNPVVWLRNSLGEVIRARKALGPNANIIDLVQLMLFPDLGHVTDVHAHGEGRAPPTPMTEREIVAQSMTFLLAGYETTSAAFAFFCHEMAKRPQVQNQIYQEIVEEIKQDQVDYDSIQGLEYFDAVFNEVCRLYPTASFLVTRQAHETRRYNDVTVPAGMNVLANVWALHRDGELWEDPQQFRPERFLNGAHHKKSFCFLPFGAGPRHCIGMRFALVEAKVTLVKLFKNFFMEKGDNLKDDLQLISRGAIVPKEAVNVKITARPRDTRRRHRNFRA